MPESRPELAVIQDGFTAWLRDPERAPLPAGSAPQRLAVYRELVFENVASFMSNCYPVVRAILGELRWRALLAAWLREHRARTVSFPRLPQELLRWLEARGLPADVPPFLGELAEYEWLELEVSFDDGELDRIAVDAEIDVWRGVPILNPTARLRRYRWPVHRLGTEFQPASAPAEPTYLAVVRTRDDEVRFVALTPATARLVDLIAADAGATGGDLVATVARELGVEPCTLERAGRVMLEDLRVGGVLLGARRREAGLP